MCGLYASIGFEPDPRRLDLVDHRGPDGRGFKVYNSVAGPIVLGHRRLAIIETGEAGQQPMSDLDDRFHIIFNGEIYNYIELRDELRAAGEVFHTLSDTEVLLRSYIVWGVECLNRLSGMFAFLIWDQRHQKLFAARDRFGIKPLYWLKTSSGIAFGSEIKQLHNMLGSSGRMNVPRIHDFLANGITDHTHETLFDGIFQLRPGEFMEVDASTSRPCTKLKRWYAYNAQEVSMNEDEAAEEFRHLLSESVRLHLRSDVSIGSCLSGGLDSSSIVSLMAGLLPHGERVNTVSACYAEKSVDEKPFMDEVVKSSHTNAYYIYPRAEDIFKKAADITWHQDEPFGSTSIFAQWCVFEEAKRAGIKVMLDGQGADEQLAGYHSAFPFYLAQLIKSGRFVGLARTIEDRRRLHGVSYYEQLKRAIVPLLPEQIAQPLRRKRIVLTQYDWLGSDLLNEKGNSDGAMSVAARAVGINSPSDIASLCIAMTFGSNLQMLLHWEDRNSMAHSIEARVPFLDHRLVEFSLDLGNNYKIKGAETKSVLRRAMHNILPPKVLHRQDKLGFATPEQAWFRGPLKGLIYDGVEKTLALYPDLLNKNGVRALRDSMLNGERAIDFSLWRIVNLGIWGDRFQLGI